MCCEVRVSDADMWLRARRDGAVARGSPRCTRTAGVGLFAGRGGAGCGDEAGEGSLWALWRRDWGKRRLWALLQCGEWEDGGCGAALGICATECGTAEGACLSHACEGRWDTAQCPQRMRSGSPAATPVGARVSGGCVRRRVRRARGRAGSGCARGSTQPLLRSAPCYVLCCRAAVLPGFARHHDHREAVGKLSLGFRHTARRRLWRAACGGVGREPGSLEPGARVQRALRTPSPLLLRRERVVVGRGHGQRTREMRWRREGAPSAR